MKRRLHVRLQHAMKEGPGGMTSVADMQKNEQHVASPKLGAEELRLPDLTRNKVLPSMGKPRLRLAVEEEVEEVEELWLLLAMERSRSVDATSLLREGVE